MRNGRRLRLVFVRELLGLRSLPSPRKDGTGSLRSEAASTWSLREGNATTCDFGRLLTPVMLFLLRWNRRVSETLLLDLGLDNFSPWYATAPSPAALMLHLCATFLGQ